MIEKEADYVLALKANHKKLYKQVQSLFENNVHHQDDIYLDIYCDEKSLSGRVEKRIVSIISADLIEHKDKFENLKTLIQVKYVCIKKRTPK